MVIRSEGRQGRGNIGCLFTLVLLAAFIYVAIAFGRPWFAFQQYRDEMRTVLSVHESLTDSAIVARLTARADSLRLPPEAKRLTLRRLAEPPRIEVRAEYRATVELPLLGPKVITFRPSAEEEL